MKIIIKRHIGSLMNLMTVTMLFFVIALVVACSGDKDASDSASKSPVLRIYVYSPENPIQTRANTGYVLASYSEKEIHSLQIWVFEHASGNLVGYINPSEVSVLNTSGQDSYEIAVTRDFAETKPSVDVYVLANCSTANCGSTFGLNTTREELDAALIANTGTADYYGTTTLQTSVNTNEGLPMSGVLKEQPIYGESPVLRVGTSEQLATVRLVRAISKLRFVFGRSEDSEELNILSISLDANVIPTAQYLMLDAPYTGLNYRISPLSGRTDSDYEAAVTLASNIGTIAGYESPDEYCYLPSMTAQTYENLIETGISNGHITHGGLFYLRESDRALTGTIRYQVGSEEPAEAHFTMTSAGDFSRNHTWIVYAYYDAGDDLHLVTVYVKQWDEANIDSNVYNW